MNHIVSTFNGARMFPYGLYPPRKEPHHLPPCQPPKIIRVEGLRLLSACLAAGWSPQSLVVAPQCIADVSALLRQRPPSASPVVLHVATERFVRGTMVQGRLEPIVAEGVLKQNTAPGAQLPAGPAIVLACQDPNNMGTIVRTAVALGEIEGGGGARRTCCYSGGHGTCYNMFIRGSYAGRKQQTEGKDYGCIRG